MPARSLIAGEAVERRRPARDDRAAGSRSSTRSRRWRRTYDRREHLHGPAADEPVRHRRLAAAGRRHRRVVAERLGLDTRPGAPVGTLSVARRQMVEIAKALSRDARLIVLDEPSAVLGDAELQGLVRRHAPPRREGRGVHLHLAPPQGGVPITDRVTVMKDGRVVATERTADLTPDRARAPRWSDATCGRDLRRAARRGRGRRGARGTRPDPRGCHRRDRRSWHEPVRSSGSPGWPARAAPRCCGRSTAPTRSTRATIEMFGQPVTIRSPRDADRARHRAADRGPQGRRTPAAAGVGIQRDHLAARRRRAVGRDPHRPRRTASSHRYIDRLVDPDARASAPGSGTCPAATSRR